jgi:hypothetical protein
MRQITIRKVKETTILKAKHWAKEGGVAVNTVDSDFGPEWNARMKELQQVTAEERK